MKPKTAERLDDPIVTISKTILKNLLERSQRTIALYDKIPDKTTRLYQECFDHDMSICFEAQSFFKKKLFGDKISSEEELASQKFQPKKFAKAFEYWFRLQDSSEDGSKKDFNLRENVMEWIKLSKETDLERK